MTVGNTNKNQATDRDALAVYQHMRRVFLFLAILVVSACLLFIGSAWGDSTTHDLIEIVGVGLIVIGILGRVWSTLYIGGRKAQMVVTEGPYSIMRNPLYFFSAIAAVGAGAQTGSIIIALVFGIFTVLAFHIVIRREEAFLSGTFGAPYQDYLARVPRFFPNFSLFRDLPIIEVGTARVYSTLKDGLVFFIALPLLELVETGQESGWLPVLFQLY